METKHLFDTDWESELLEGETLTRSEDGDKINVVLLSGLQRLARMAGITGQEVVIQTPSENMIQAIFKSTFRVLDTSSDSYYEVSFVGTADCSGRNTDGKFKNYPTAVAESRAEARSLRKALGIKMLSSEEIGFRDSGTAAVEASPNKKVDSQIVAALERLCESRKLDVAEALESALGAERAADIFEFSELSTSEGQAVMSWLNSQSTRKGKK